MAVVIALTPAISQTSTVRVQFEEARFYVPVALRSGPVRWFILDTGAQPTLIDSRVADSTGVRSRAAGATTGAGGKQTPIADADDVTLRIASIGLGPLSARVAPLDSLLGPSSGRAIPGIIGSRFFREHVVELDPAASVMRVNAPETFVYRGTGVEVPLDIVDDIPFTQGWIEAPNGKRYAARMLVDLGAKANLLVTEPFTRMHGLDRVFGASVTTEFGAGMGGETHYQFVRAASLGLSGNERTRLESPIVGLSSGGTLKSTRYDALLGADYLAHFRMIFDYARKRLILEPLSSSAGASAFDMSGLFIIAPDAGHRRLTVKSVLPGSSGALAGIRAGDVITRIDTNEGETLTLAAARHQLRAQEGGTVRVQVERGGRVVVANITLRRML
ncbi:MAG: aspartyl protease family protein [bacterium]